VVHLGYFAMPLHPKERVYREVMEENRAAVILADQLGFSEAWIGEHQTSVSEPITDPYLFLATMIHQTKNIKFGTAVLNLSYHHPVKLGMQIAMFDQLSGGRTLVGIGLGGLISDSEIFGVDRDRSYEMMMECINIMDDALDPGRADRIQGRVLECHLEGFHRGWCGCRAHAEAVAATETTHRLCDAEPEIRCL
jgi:alkanesulfonate monooxygenase SsuD/methylene tetrahydromethanopterin reductase-like flavin-dependent oxidoreductase (luciferase family)